MTIAKIVGFNRNITVERSDRGGNSMNLISEVLMKLVFKNKRGNYKVKVNRNFGEDGYALYQSLEYNFKHLEKYDLGLREFQLNRIMR